MSYKASKLSSLLLYWLIQNFDVENNLEFTIGRNDTIRLYDYGLIRIHKRFRIPKVTMVRNNNNDPKRGLTFKDPTIWLNPEDPNFLTKIKDFLKLNDIV